MDWKDYGGVCIGGGKGGLIDFSLYPMRLMVSLDIILEIRKAILKGLETEIN